MNFQENDSHALSLKGIEAVFAQIPKAHLLQLARSVQTEILNDSSRIHEKAEGELVTEADRRIQECLLEYFASSSLSGRYIVKAEEETNRIESIEGKEIFWQLILDPLDGTRAFSEGAPYWGIMVGLCDKSGAPIFSWNMRSDGSVFSSADSRHPNRSGRQPNFRIDVYDYDCGAKEKFLPALSHLPANPLSGLQLEVISSPAAVWSGGELANGNLDALFWLPGTRGKRSYPDYDLIFLGALKAQGWKIRLAKNAHGIQCVFVAETNEILTMLLGLAGDILEFSELLSFEDETSFSITGALS